MLTLAILTSIGTAIIILFLLGAVVYLWITQASGCRNCGHDVFYQAFNGLERCEECDWPKEEIFPDSKVIIVEMVEYWKDGSLDCSPVCLVITDKISEVRRILSAKGILSKVSLLTEERKEALYKDRGLLLPLVVTLKEFREGIGKDWIEWTSVVGWQKYRLGYIDYQGKIISICQCFESSISPLWRNSYRICAE